MTVYLRPWARVLLLVAAPMRLTGMMSSADVAALRAFVAEAGRRGDPA